MRLEQQLAIGHLGEMALWNLGSFSMAQATIGQNWNSNSVVEAYITSMGASNKPMGPLWTLLGPSLSGSIILWSPCLTWPCLHPWLSLPLAPWRPIIWGTLGDNHIYRGHCKPTTLIRLHSNLTTSPSPWSPFNGGLMVDIFATFLPKISISS